MAQVLVHEDYWEVFNQSAHSERCYVEKSHELVDSELKICNMTCKNHAN